MRNMIKQIRDMDEWETSGHGQGGKGKKKQRKLLRMEGDGMSCEG